jgi:hypothetical protein
MSKRTIETSIDIEAGTDVQPTCVGFEAMNQALKRRAESAPNQ